jgi:hypothetical protein
MNNEGEFNFKVYHMSLPCPSLHDDIRDEIFLTKGILMT